MSNASGSGTNILLHIFYVDVCLEFVSHELKILGHILFLSFYIFYNF